jgi:hypothetical protein
MVPVLMDVPLPAVSSPQSTCYAIGGMDPGRNGIIYRMTNQRAKTS